MTETNRGPSESTPLLQEEYTAHDQAITGFPNQENIANVEAGSQILASQYFKRPIHVLTQFLIIASPIATILCIASAITSYNGPFRGRPWHTIDNLQLLVLTLIVVLIVACLDLYQIIHISVNLIADFGLFYYLAFLVADILNYPYAFPQGVWCESYKDNHSASECFSWLLAVQIMIGIALGLVTLIVITHFVLLVLRLIAVVRTKFWRNFPWVIPAGQLSLEITIRIRPDGRNGTMGREDAATTV